MVGSDARTLLSLVISCPPAASGTLKSTRMKVVLSFKSRSRIETFDIYLRFLKMDLSRLHIVDLVTVTICTFLRNEKRLETVSLSVQPRDRVPPNCLRFP